MSPGRRARRRRKNPQSKYRITFIARMSDMADPSSVLDGAIECVGDLEGCIENEARVDRVAISENSVSVEEIG